MDSLSEQLYEAVSVGNSHRVTELLQKGAVATVICSTGCTALGVAAQLGHTSILQILLQHASSFLSSSTTPSYSIRTIHHRYHHHGHRYKIRACHHHNNRSKRTDSDDSESTAGAAFWTKRPRGKKCWARKHSHHQQRLPVHHQTDDSVAEDGPVTSDSGEESSSQNYSSGGVKKAKKNVGYFVFVHQEERSSGLEAGSSELSQEENCCGASVAVDENRNRAEVDGSGANSTTNSLQLSADTKTSMKRPCEEASVGYYPRLEDDLPPQPSLPQVEEDRTPEGMEKLEWDSEGMGEVIGEHEDEEEGEEEEEPDVAGGGTEQEEEEEEDSDERVRDRWTCFYKDYAEILDYSTSLLEGSLHQWDVNQLDIHGRSALHYAAEQGHLKAVRLLADAGCRVDTGDADSVTPLYLASTRGHTEVVQVLLERGAKVNGKTSDKTSALHIAASRGFADVVETLLSAGAKVDTLDASDQTPLLMAVSRGEQEVVALLIKRGAKVNIEEIRGYTPLCYAVWKKDVLLARLLLSAGARLTQSHFLLHYAVLHRQLPMVQVLLEAGSLVNLRDDNGDTPLTLAAKSGQVAVVQMLLDNEANTNYPNGLTGATPLHEAVEGIRICDYSTFESVFHLLRSHGARMDQESFTPGDTSLYRALLMDKDKAAALLIRHGSDVNLGKVYSCNVDNMALATWRGSFFMVRLLVMAGFNMSNVAPRLVEGKIAKQPDSINTVKGWLTHAMKNPFGLTELCRMRIRKQLGDRVHAVVRASKLPERIKRFLMLEDVQEGEL